MSNSQRKFNFLSSMFKNEAFLNCKVSSDIKIILKKNTLHRFVQKFQLVITQNYIKFCII